MMSTNKTILPIQMNSDACNDELLNDELNDFLNDSQMATPVEECCSRLDVLERLRKLFEGWLEEVSRMKGYDNVDKSTIGRLYTFGSYRLGLITRTSDVDVLCVVARYIDREDFFSSFLDLLKIQEDVKDARCIGEAFVPIIKLTYDGIDIDLLFARLDTDFIPEYINFRDDRVFMNLDQRCIRSLGGIRVAETMMDLVPNIDVFVIVLKAIKLWAKRRSIYSSIIGYLGGVSWTILVAKVCQIYRTDLSPSKMIYRFFLFLSNWNWPKPIMIAWMSNMNMPLDIPSWNPARNFRDRHHLMPIITPCYPHSNSAYNVSKFTKQIIEEECQRGMKVMEEILVKKSDWNALFEPLNFFKSYKHFVVVTATTKLAGDSKEWKGFVESKLRFFTQQLELKMEIKMARVNPVSLPEKNDDNAAQWFYGIEFASDQQSKIDLTDSVQTFVDNVYRMSGLIRKDGMNVEVQYLKKKELPDFLGHIPLVNEVKISNDDASEMESQYSKICEHYLVVKAGSIIKKNVWEGHIGSKLKILKKLLQDNPEVRSVYMDPISTQVNNVTTQWLIGLEFLKARHNQKIIVDLTENVQTFVYEIYESGKKIRERGMTLNIQYARRDELSHFQNDKEILKGVTFGGNRLTKHEIKKSKQFKTVNKATKLFPSGDFTFGDMNFTNMFLSDNIATRPIFGF